MPKEIILALGGPQGPGIAEALVEVGWQRDLEHVQIVTYGRDPESLETRGRDEAMFATLDRSGINQLIRVLRRARCVPPS